MSKSTRSLNARRGVLALATVAVAAPTATLALAADGPVPVTTQPDGALTSGIGLHEQIKLAGRDLAERRVLRTARKVAKLRDDRLPRGYSLKLDRYTAAELASKQRRLARTLRKLRERKRTGGAPNVAIPAALASIAACESGGNPRAIGGGGAFRGKYQFTYSTWAAVGGSGDPAAAPEAEQDRRAAILYNTAGPGQWPVCSR